MADVKADPQGNMFDREVFDAELEAVCRILEDEANKKSQKALNLARKSFKEKVKALEMNPGERVRCGDFVLTGRGMSGGGFTTEKWETVSARRAKFTGGTSA